MPFGTQPTKREVWGRVWWNLTHLLSPAFNPYVLTGSGDLLPKKRTGLEDLFHSIEDVYREWQRRRRT